MDNTENVQNVEQTENVETTQVEVSLDEIVAQYSKCTREELVEQMQQLLDEDNYEKMKSRIPLIRNAFNVLPEPELEVVEVQPEIKDEEGNVIQKAETKTLENATTVKFRELYSEYKTRRQIQQEKEERERQENLAKKQSLLQELSNLVESELPLKEMSDKYKDILDRWGQVGTIPHTEVNNLWSSFSFLKEKFYEKVKIFNELRDLDRKKNLEDKLALCEKVEELLLIDDIDDSFSMLQAYHKAWKEIGPVPTDKNDEIWDRFKRASDEINQRRREFYQQRLDNMEENKTKKLALTEQLSDIIKREFKTMAQWTTASQEANALFEQWKAIGPVPKNDSETMWAKFKNMLDAFYEAKKQASQQQRNQEIENLNKKTILCVKAEEIAKRTDFDAATKELKQLQEEWKTIGYVRKNQSKKIWLRFRAACDEFFARKSESYLQVHQEVMENIKKKEDLLEELKNYQFSEDKQQNVETLKDFQKRWIEVGFTPKDERKRLQEAWDDVINSNRDKLSISAEEIASRSKSRFQQNLDRLKEQGTDAMQKRIDAINSEIDRIENNLGFFANSKNADLLKKEFESKIAKLKGQKREIQEQMAEMKNSTNPSNTDENKDKE